MAEEQMTVEEAIRARHSVRQYLDKPIEAEVRESLDQMVSEINGQTGLDIQIIYDDPDGFDSKMAHYGNFQNVSNYIVLAGDKNEDIDELCGYYGEKLVIEAQKMGLRTCWVYLTFNKKRVRELIPANEKLVIVIALGYGAVDGSQHKSKEITEVSDLKNVSADAPDWYQKGMELALLAPTAVNQQKFKIGIEDGKPVFRTSGIGTCLKVDLGIVRYHFEVGAGMID